MIASFISYWRQFSDEFRQHPIIMTFSMTFGVLMSAICLMMGLLALMKLVRFIITPHDYLFGAIRIAGLAVGIFAIFGVAWLSYDRKNDRLRTFPVILGILSVLILGGWAFDGEAPFCGWEGVFGHIPWCG